jgi:uncharacterized membrane protein
MKHLLIIEAVKAVGSFLVMEKTETKKGKKAKVSPLKSTVIVLMTALAAILYDAGYISEGTQDCLSGAIAEDVAKQIDKIEK